MGTIFAEADLCIGWVILLTIFAVPFGLAHYIPYALKQRAARKEAEFQINHPEVWRQRELLKLEKERMAAEKEAAEKRAKEQTIHRGIGLAAGIGRALGWW
jgi:hypothetical protein